MVNLPPSCLATLVGLAMVLGEEIRKQEGSITKFLVLVTVILILGNPLILLVGVPEASGGGLERGPVTYETESTIGGVNVTFGRRLSGDRVGQHKVPPSTEVTMEVSAKVDNRVENADLIDYFPNEWTIIDVNNGKISRENENYMKIVWHVGTIIDSISKFYVVKSPKLTTPPTNYYFHSELNWDNWSPKSDPWSVKVADPTKLNENYTYVSSENVYEGGTTGVSGAGNDDGTYENIYENDYGGTVLQDGSFSNTENFVDGAYESNASRYWVLENNGSWYYSTTADPNNGSWEPGPTSGLATGGGEKYNALGYDGGTSCPIILQENGQFYRGDAQSVQNVTSWSSVNSPTTDGTYMDGDYENNSGRFWALMDNGSWYYSTTADPNNGSWEPGPTSGLATGGGEKYNALGYDGGTSCPIILQENGQFYRGDAQSVQNVTSWSPLPSGFLIN